MTHYHKSKAVVLKSLLLLMMLTMASTLGYGSGKGKSSLSNRQNNGHVLSQELSDLSGDSDKMVDVIIQFRNLPSDADTDAVKGLGGLHKGQLHLINGNLYSVPKKALQHLANNPNILYITPDRKSQQFSDYALQSLNVNLVQNNLGFDGSGVGVAVIDSGIYAHPDLKDKFG